MISKYKHLFIIASLILVCYIIKYQYLVLPFYFEEKPYTLFNVFHSSFYDMLTNQYSSGMFAHHPLALPLTIAPFIYFVVASPLVIHSTMFFISSLGLIFIGLNLRELKPNISKFYYYLTPLTLLLYPDFFVHMSNYRYDIFTGVVAIITLFMHLRNHLSGYFIMGVLLSQSRETVLAFIISFLLIDLIKAFKYKEKRTKWIIAGFIHLLLWASYFIKNYWHHGKLSTSQAHSEINNTLLSYLDVLSFDLYWLFIKDFRFVFTFILCFILLKNLRVHLKYKIELLYLILPILFYCLGMGFHIFKASYYLYPVLFFIYLLFAYFYSEFKDKMTPLFLLVFSLCCFFYLNNQKSQVVMSENGTGYKDIVLNYRAAIQYMNKNYRFKKINAEWPLLFYMKDRTYFYSYTNFPFAKSHFKNLWDKDTDIKVHCDKFKKKFEFIIIPYHSNHNIMKQQFKYAKKCDYELIKKVGNDLNFISIYQRSI